jgi:hypothetical protein
MTCIEFSPSDGFTLGTTTLTYAIASPELAAEVPIVFEVKTRLERWNIFLFIAAGLILSYVLKVVLHRRIELGQARLLAFDLIEKVRADLRDHPDPTFIHDTKKELDALVKAAAGTDAAAIETARGLLNARWLAASTDLTNRRQAVQQTIDPLRKVTQSSWAVPTALLQKLAAADAALDLVQRDLMADQIDEAAAGAGAVEKQLRRDLIAEASRWQQSVVQYLDALAAAPRGLSPAVKTGLAAAVAEARSAIGQTTFNPAATGSDDLVQLLLEMSTERRAARKGPLALGAAMLGETAQADGVLTVDAKTLATLRGIIDVAGQKLVEFVDDPDAGIQVFQTALDSVSAGWREMLTVVGGGALPAPADALLKQSQFVEATAALDTAMHPPVEADAVADITMPEEPDLLWPMVGDAGSLAQIIERRTIHALPRIPPIVAARQRTLFEIALAKLWQSALIAILLGLIGYGLYAPKFVGDYHDFLVIFFWAFGLDLTADTLMKVAPK